MNEKDIDLKMIFKEGLERDLAEDYITSISSGEPLAEQEQRYWLFKNYSVENNGSHDLRCFIYEIHTKEFKRQLREMK